MKSLAAVFSLILLLAAQAFAQEPGYPSDLSAEPNHEVTRWLHIALKQADREVPRVHPGQRGHLVERRMQQILGDPKEFHFNVQITLHRGVRFVSGLDGQFVTMRGQTLGEADVVRMKVGRSLRLGQRLDPSEIDTVWEVKSGNAEFNRRQRGNYLRAFSKRPIILLAGRNHPIYYRDVPVALRGRIARELGGAAQFAGAYLIKEAILSLDADEAGRWSRSLAALGTLEFWGSLAAFSGAAQVAQRALWLIPPVTGVGVVARGALALAAGSAAVQTLHGEFSAHSIALSTASLLTAGFLVNAVADRAVASFLFAAGPQRWWTAGLYETLKLSGTRILAEKLQSWVLSALSPARSSARPGIRQSIDSLSGGR